MKIRQEDVIIDETNPFSSCKLNRKKYADILTNIVTTYSDGFVIAINNEWGTGKTTFVKMWQQQLLNQGYRTIYFNAWENDFGTNPLVALMAELKTLLNKKNENQFNSLIKKGSAITKNVLPALFKSIASKYIDVEMLDTAIENITKAATEILQNEIDNYTSKKQSLLDFKNKLTEFVENVTGNKPVIFIIDELDRCRPNYAVQVLEQVKHFFSVRGIVFALSIDKEQLGNAIRGSYGSDRIDAAEYLRRFIDIEYVIEPPDPIVYCNYLYDYFEFDKFIKSEQRKRIDHLRNDRDNLLTIASHTFHGMKLSLRQQEKLFAHVRLVLNSFNYNSYIFPSLLIILVYMRAFFKDLYTHIKLLDLEINELQDKFYVIFPKNIYPEQIYYFTYMEANLIFMYRNSLWTLHHQKTNLFEVDESKNEICAFKSRFTPSDSSTFEHQLKSFEENYKIESVNLGYLISKIDLIDTVIL